MDLPLNQHLVQYRPAVVNRDVAHQPRLARLDVHLDHRDVASKWKGLIVLLEIDLCDKCGLRGKLRPAQRGRRHAGDTKAPIRHAHDVLSARLQPSRRLRPRLLNERDACAQHRAAAELQRARPRRPRPSSHHPGVRLHDPNAVDRHSEHL